MGERQQVFNALLRRDLSSFVHRTFNEVSAGNDYEHAWYIEALAWQLQLCFEGKIKRLVINMPPRYGKSIAASVAFVAWVLGHAPQTRIVCASYGDELAGKFARDTLKVMRSSWYAQAFPKTRLGNRVAAHDFRTTVGGGRFATSVGGVLTGIGGDIFIIDDPNKGEDVSSEAGRARVREWFRSTLSTRLNDRRTGVIIVVQQRLHVDDLSGELLAEGSDWVHLNLPATAVRDEDVPIGPGLVHRRRIGDLLHPSRDDHAALARQQHDMGSQLFSAQFQQDPLPADGELVKWQWFRTYPAAPNFATGDQFVQSWDTAVKAGELNDFSVGTTWLIRNGDYYLLDVNRVRATFPDLKRTVIQYAQRFGIDTLLIEDKGSGTPLIDVLIEEDPPGVPRPIRVVPTLDKITRLFAQTNQIEQGRVHLPAEASWLAAFRSELLQFPHGKHDDQVDSLSQFLEWAVERKTLSVYVIRYRI